MIVGKESIPTENVLTALAEVYARAYAANVTADHFPSKAEERAKSAMNHFFHHATELLKQGDST